MKDGHLCALLAVQPPFVRTQHPDPSYAPERGLKFYSMIGKCRDKALGAFPPDVKNQILSILRTLMATGTRLVPPASNAVYADTGDTDYINM